MLASGHAQYHAPTLSAGRLPKTAPGSPRSIEGQLSDIAFELEDAPIFQGLTDEELTFLRRKMRLESHTPGESLLHFGHDPPGLYVIRSGLVKALVPSESGAEREVATIGKGECLGEMALLTGEPCSATVRTISDTQAWLLDTAEFTEFVEHYPTVWRNLSRILSQRLMRRNLSMRSYANTIALLLDCPDDQSSALALAIAESLARETGKRTLLIDARGTTACPISQLTPAQLSPSMGKLSRQKGLLKHHRADIDASNGSSRARIANLNDDEHEELTEDEIVSVLESLQAVYDFVLLLLRPGAGGQSSAFVRRADALTAVVTDPGGGAIPSWLANLAQVKEAADKIDVAVVTGSGDASLLIGEIELSFGRAVVRLPIDKEMLRAMALENQAGCDRLDPAVRTSVDRLVRQVSKTQVGLALGAGAAKGFAHIGVLKLFEEEQIPIDYIAGCSIGAVVGAMHARGMTLRDIHQTMHGADQKLKRWTLPLRSVWSASGLTELLRAPGANVRFRDLDIPFATVATDIRTGRELVIRRGLVWKAVQASTSVPGIFPATKVFRRHLVDGGLVNPVPSQTVRDLGADIVIAVDLMSPAAHGHGDSGSSAPGGSSAKGQPMLNLVETLWRSNEIMQEEVTLHSAATADITIAPNLGRVRWSDFSHRGRELAALGEQAAREKLPEIERLLGRRTTVEEAV